MDGKPSALALAGSPANFVTRRSGTILVYVEGRTPPDIIRLEPPLPMEEADELAARIKTGVDYAKLGIVSTDLVTKPANQSRWFMRR